MKFKAGDETYQTDRHGVVHQINAKPYVYDEKYCSTYDTPDYVRKSELLQALRFGFATGAHGRKINSLIDVGPGNGAFMKFALQRVRKVYGHDISNVPVPEGCEYIEDVRTAVDVICYWDCIEHIPDLAFVKDIRAETICISLPFYPGRDIFENWPHRKPGEHLHHFTDESLAKFMKSMSWEQVCVSDHEDIVRQRYGVEWNILSCAFKRK